MGEHLDRKHAVILLEDDPDTLSVLISQCALREEDRQILRMVHFGHHDQQYIADMVGLSVQGMRKRYYGAVTKLYRLAELRKLIPTQ